VNKILAALKILFKNPAYLFLALVLASVLFLIYFLVNDISLFRSAAAISGSLPFLWKVFANQVSMIARINGWFNVLAIGLVAVLGGINLALTILRVWRTRVFIGRASLMGILGTFGGALAASCSACTSALVSLLGITGGLAIFPFGGLEISLLAIVVLSASLYFASKSLVELGLT